MSDTVSADSIRAQMPHNVLTRVLREPAHNQIKMVIRELTANLMAVFCPWGHGKGHLGLLQDPRIYEAHNGEVFTTPANKPPAYTKHRLIAHLRGCVKYPHILVGYTEVSVCIHSYLRIQVDNLPVTMRHTQHTNTHHYSHNLCNALINMEST
jgi:hypothetical protein